MHIWRKKEHAHNHSEGVIQNVIKLWKWTKFILYSIWTMIFHYIKCEHNFEGCYSHKRNNRHKAEKYNKDMSEWDRKAINAVDEKPGMATCSAKLGGITSKGRNLSTKGKYPEETWTSVTSSGWFAHLRIVWVFIMLKCLDRLLGEHCRMTKKGNQCMYKLR